MKKLLLTLSLLTTFFATYAQNTFPSTGSVGIGTTSPAQPLDVTGTGGAFSSTAKANASFLQDHTNYRGLYLGYDSSGQIGVIGAGTYGTPSSLAFWNYNSGWFEAMRLTSAGNLGIGTISPQAKLDVNGAISMQSFGNISSQRTNNNSYTSLFLGGALKDNNNGTFTVVGDGGSNYFGAIRMDNSGGNVGAINFYTGASTGGSSYSITNATLTSDLAMSIVGGNVAIGTSNPNGYKLAINGNAIATSFTVKAYTNWPDYVFKSNYRLPSLNDVKTYIDQNHHLPDVPSAEQVAKDGLNLGDISKITMQKVEELTLYLIQKDEKIDEQQKQIDSLKEQLKSQDEHFKQLDAVLAKLAGSK